MSKPDGHSDHGFSKRDEPDENVPASEVDADANSTISLGKTLAIFPDREFPTIPGYQILAELGRGAMGVVYKALQTGLKRTVALKMILDGAHTNQQNLARFQSEAEAVARIQHPNILQIYEIGEQNGLPFFSMEFADGGNLEERFVGKPLAVRSAVEMIETLATAMHVAHVRGIVHRDLKPANVLLTHDGTLKISDFGVAKKLDDDAVLQTQAGAILGTPRYMAPEQAAGKSSLVSPATDIYALGVMLYELLTGQAPFPGKSVVDTLHQVRMEDPKPPSRLQPKLHRDLDTICLKCLEKNPGNRYSSALALSQELRRFLDGEPIESRPISRQEKWMRWIKRRPAAASLIALVALIVPISLNALWIIVDQAKTTRDLATNEAYEIKIPIGLTSFSIPSDNQMTVGKVALGKQLFFDPRLSIDNSVSCATCHDPVLGWGDGKAFATGVGGQEGIRGAPTIINSAYQFFLFWDGRSPSLEEQSTEPIFNPIEMGMSSEKSLEDKLNLVHGYRTQFQQVFGTDVTVDGIADAIVAFERTILSGNAPFDRYKAGDKSAMSESAIRGMNVFFNDAHCSACHSGPNFTDGAFHNIGVGIGATPLDTGREKITGIEGDRNSFKTPILREIARTAPYMHNGSLKTLDEVVDHYNKGGISDEANLQLDEEIYPLGLTVQQKQDLITFLKEGLSSPDYPYVEPPALPK